MRYSTFIITKGKTEISRKYEGKKREKTLNIGNCLLRKEPQWSWGRRILHKTDEKLQNILSLEWRRKVIMSKEKCQKATWHLVPWTFLNKIRVIVSASIEIEKFLWNDEYNSNKGQIKIWTDLNDRHSFESWLWLSSNFLLKSIVFNILTYV